MRYTGTSFFGTLALTTALVVAIAGIRTLSFPRSQLETRNQKLETVFVTSSGTHYHQPGCRYLSRSSHAIPLDLSRAGRLTPCSVCN